MTRPFPLLPFLALALWAVVVAAARAETSQQPRWLLLEKIANHNSTRQAWAINCALSPKDSVEASTLLLPKGYRIVTADIWPMHDWAPKGPCATTITKRTAGLPTPIVHENRP